MASKTIAELASKGTKRYFMYYVAELMLRLLSLTNRSILREVFCEQCNEYWFMVRISNLQLANILSVHS